MNKKYSFQVSKKKINIEYIYGSINITNIENYLKSIEEQENENKNLNLVIIPNKCIYDDLQLFWTIFIAKNRFEDKINIAKNLQTEVLLLLSLTNQINKIDSCFKISKNKKDYFIFFVYENEINLKNITQKLKINEKEIIYNKQEAKEYYNIKEDSEVLNKIIEKISFI
jgi:tRNA threonylcarbamoyladenosine modification (KEOPS) complex Cgi121 subunit